MDTGGNPHGKEAVPNKERSEEINEDFKHGRSYDGYLLERSEKGAGEMIPNDSIKFYEPPEREKNCEHKPVDLDCWVVCCKCGAIISGKGPDPAIEEWWRKYCLGQFDRLPVELL